MSLTGRLDDPESAVRRHFEAAYPHIKEVRFSGPGSIDHAVDEADPTRSSRSTGSTLARPRCCQAPTAGEGRYDWGAAGTAFDYRVRLLLAPQDPAGFVAAAGARNLARRWRQPAPTVAWSELVEAIAGLRTEPSHAREAVATPSPRRSRG